MRYLVQERIFSFKADFWIEDEDGNRVFFADGRALSLRETFELRDASGQLRALIRKKVFAPCASTGYTRTKCGSGNTVTGAVLAVFSSAS